MPIQDGYWGKIGPESKQAELALIIALQDREPVVRLNVAEALVKIIGPEAKLATPILI